MYLSGASVAMIKSVTGVDRRQIYRLLDRCVMLHEDGRPWGWRGLVPYARTSEYRRSAALEVTDQGAGAAGAFSLLLQANPGLQDWIGQAVRKKRISIEQIGTDNGFRTRLRNLKPLHLEFLKQCRAFGLGGSDYPFNTERMGIRSLAVAVRAECLRDFDRGARLAGAKHVKGMPPDAATPATAPLEVVEFDGHRLDVRLKVVVRDPLGFEQQFEIERIWLLVIIDVYSRAVLSYHLSLNREYSRYDVIRTIEAALEPHRPRRFTLPGVGYGEFGGFPSAKFAELGFATWQWLKLDNAKANLADDVRYALADFIGCFIDAGPAHSPDDRPYIERFFGSIASTLSSRLPGYTGTGPRDARRVLADPKGNLRLFVSLDELEELVDAAIGVYNGTPHDGLNGRTPLEAIEHGVRSRGLMLNWLPEAKRRTLCLMQSPRRASVRGYLHQGQRPHINFHGVRYSNRVLASTAAFLGQEVRIYYNSQDLRTVRAFGADGAEVGVLKAQGAWGEIAHDLKLRQEIVRLRGRKRLASALSQEFLQQFIARKLQKAKASRRQASDMTRTLRALAAAPTSQSAMKLRTDAHDPVPAPVVPTPEQVPVEHVEPEILRIGTGYVGTL
jgi:transposase InsO family protein